MAIAEVRKNGSSKRISSWAASQFPDIKSWDKFCLFVYRDKLETFLSAHTSCVVFINLFKPKSKIILLALSFFRAQHSALFSRNLYWRECCCVGENPTTPNKVICSGKNPNRISRNSFLNKKRLLISFVTKKLKSDRKTLPPSISLWLSKCKMLPCPVRYIYASGNGNHPESILFYFFYITVGLHGSKTVLAFVFYKSNSYIEKWKKDGRQHPSPSLSLSPPCQCNHLILLRNMMKYRGFCADAIVSLAVCLADFHQRRYWSVNADARSFQLVGVLIALY